MKKVVAVIGASSRRHKFGNKAVRAFQAEGFTVVPIHPRASEIEGLKAYRLVLEVPGPIDMATLYVRPDVGEQLLPELEAKQVGEIRLNPGAESPSLLEAARRRNLNVITGCSIVAIGRSPSEF